MAIRPVAALSAAGGLALLSVIGLRPASSVDGPFNPDYSYVLIAQAEPASSCPSGMGTQLFEGVQVEDKDESITVKYDEIGSPSCVQYNAISYDPVDDYVYGIANNNHVVRIDSGAVVTDTNVVLPAAAKGHPYTFGTYVPLTATSGQLVIADGNATGTNSYYTIPLSGGSATTPDTVGTPVNHTFTRGVNLPTGAIVLPNLADWVYIGGYVFGLDTNVDNTPRGEFLYRLEPSSGQLSRSTLPAAFVGIGTAAFGGQWVYGNGNIGVSDNASGMIYQMRLINTDGSVYTGGTAMPTVQIVSAIQGVSSTGTVMRSAGNDATSTPGQAVDLSLVKLVAVNDNNFTPADKFLPGDDVTYTLKVTNESAITTSSGWTLDDPIPAGLTPVAVSVDSSQLPPSGAGASCHITATAVTCTGSQGLAPHESITITLTATVSGDVPIINIATVTGNEKDPDPTNNTSQADLTPPSLNFLKSASPKIVTAAPTAVTYSYVITNDGNDPAYGVHIESDVVTTTNAAGTTPTHAPVDLTKLTCRVTASPGGGLTVGAAAAAMLSTGMTLQPNDQITCTYVRTVTQADLNAGVTQIDNRATVKSFVDAALTNSGPDLTSDATVTTVLSPGITVDKALASGAHAGLTTLTDPALEGQLIGYSFQVTNTGNVTEADITVTDVINGHSAATTPQKDDFTCAYDASNSNPAHRDDVDNGVIVLDPGESATCYAQAQVALDDLDNGEVTDHATASNNDVSDQSDDVVVPLPTQPFLAFNKTIDPTDAPQATLGETLHFIFTLQDTGDIPLAGIKIDDPMPDLQDFHCHYVATNPDHNDTTIALSPTDGSITLDAATPQDPDGEEAICTATHVVNSADQAAGSIVNVASALGYMLPDFAAHDLSDPVTTPDRAVTVLVVSAGGLTPPAAPPAGPPAAPPQAPPAAPPQAPVVRANTGGSVIPTQAAHDTVVALAALSLLLGTALAIAAQRRYFLK